MPTWILGSSAPTSEKKGLTPISPAPPPVKTPPCVLDKGGPFHVHCHMHTNHGGWTIWNIGDRHNEDYILYWNQMGALGFAPMNAAEASSAHALFWFVPGKSPYPPSGGRRFGALQSPILGYNGGPGLGMTVA